MAFAERKTLTLAVDGSGDGTGYINVAYGRILSVSYIKVDYADGVDFTVTVESDGAAIWSQSNVNATTTVFPRAAVQDVLGAAALYAATFAIVEPVWMVNDRVKIVVAQGGVSKSGTFQVVIG